MSNNKFINVMVDTETVGLAHDAGIWQIGAVVFGEVSYFVEDEANFTLNPKQLLTDPRFSSLETTLEWQREKNKTNWDKAFEFPAAPVYTIAEEFSKWISSAELAYGRKARLWFKGLDFDLPKLQHLFGVIGLGTPWHYRNVMCCRTVFNLLDYKPKDFPGAHDALVDARNQAESLMDCLGQKGIEL